MSEKEKYHISKFYIKMLITIVFQSHSVMSDSLQPHRYIVHRNSPGQNTLVGSCSLLQWIFLTQGLNPVLLHCRWTLNRLSHQGSLETLSHCCTAERLVHSKARPGFNPWVGKIPWRREWQLTPVFLPGAFHGQRSLVGYSPWGHKESDMTE